MDEVLLLWVNQSWAHPGLDVLFTWLSSRPAFTLPFALTLLGLFLWRWRVAGLQLWIVLLVVVGASDATGNMLKGVFAEARPCYVAAAEVRQLGRADGEPCGASLNGMPSNHAVNAFATAAFLSAALGRRWAGLFVVAALVAVSRVYLAKHFPSQIAAGALLGTLWGIAFGWLGLKYLPFLQRIRASGAAGPPAL